MRRISTALLLIAITGFIAPRLVAQPSMEEQMKAAEPGPQHELLKTLAGKWKYTLSNYMNMTQAGKPEVTSGTETSEMILGGRFLKAETIGEMMGMKVATLSILGFDKRKGKYFVFEVDETGTYSVSAEGDYDKAASTITLHGTEEEQGQKMTFDFIYHLIDKNHYTFTIQFGQPGGGASQKVMEIAYSR